MMMTIVVVSHVDCGGGTPTEVSRNTGISTGARKPTESGSNFLSFLRHAQPRKSLELPPKGGLFVFGAYQCSRGNFDTMGPKPPPPATKETFEKRSRVLQELIDTEATFVSNLETLISRYIENFRVADSDIKKTFISDASIAVLFSNIQQIHTVNLDLLELLKRRILGHNKRNDIGERTTDTHLP